jgi:hypothetical protein
MKSVSIVLCTMLVVVSCVSSKKFKALQEQQRICTEELAKFKESSEFFQSKSELLQALQHCDLIQLDLAIQNEVLPGSWVIP